MRIDRLASVYACHTVRGIGLPRIKPGIPILMYHSVSDDGEQGVAPYHRLTTSPMRFLEQMQFLQAGRFEVISLCEAAHRLVSGLSISDRSVVLTFDDGFDDFRTHAWPVLAASGFTATMFLPTAFIGQTKQSFKGRGCLTWPDVRSLQREGVSFGAHTVNHPVLYGLPWTAIRRELRDSKQRIENELQICVQTFAYPFAFPQEDRPFVAQFRMELVDAGYSTAVTTIIGRARTNSDLRCLERLPVNDGDDEQLFGAKLKGNYDWLGRVQWASRVLKKTLNGAPCRFGR